MRYGLAHLALQEASFNQLADDLVVFVNKVNDRDISGLMLFDNRSPKNQLVALADKGKLVSTTRGMSIIMENGSVQSLGETFVVGTFDSFDMDMNISDKQVKFSFKTRRISTPKLIAAARTPKNVQGIRIQVVDFRACKSVSDAIYESDAGVDCSNNLAALVPCCAGG